MHYCVLVIHPDSVSVDDALAPYDENLAVCKSEEDGEEYWYNPDAKWDWYEIGGRWKDSLKLKSGKHVDSALVKDIDISFDMGRYDIALKYWDDVMSGALVPILESRQTFLQNFISRENYAALQAIFYYPYVINHKGEWHQMWGETWQTTLPNRLEWAQKFYTNFIRPIINLRESYRLTVVDIHN